MRADPQPAAAVVHDHARRPAPLHHVLRVARPASPATRCPDFSPGRRLLNTSSPADRRLLAQVVGQLQHPAPRRRRCRRRAAAPGSRPARRCPATLSAPPSHRPACGFRRKSMVREVERRRRRCSSRRRPGAAARPTRGGRRRCPPPPGRAATCGRRPPGRRSASAARRAGSTPSPWIASTKKKTPRSRHSSPSASRSLRKPLANSTKLSRQHARAGVHRGAQVVDLDAAAAARRPAAPRRRGAARFIHGYRFDGYSSAASDDVVAGLPREALGDDADAVRWCSGRRRRRRGSALSEPARRAGGRPRRGRPTRRTAAMPFSARPSAALVQGRDGRRPAAGRRRRGRGTPTAR